MFPTKSDFIIAGTTSETTHYMIAPCRCTISDVQAVVDADPGDGETITVKAGSATVGVCTFGSTISPGATGTYAADGTGGTTVFDEGDVITLVISALTAAANFAGFIDIDEYART